MIEIKEYAKERAIEHLRYLLATITYIAAMVIVCTPVLLVSKRFNQEVIEIGDAQLTMVVLLAMLWGAVLPTLFKYAPGIGRRIRTELETGVD